MSAVCAIHQPHYLPWLRWLAKLVASDVFVLLDDVQYQKNGWQNRNRVKGPGGPVLLTVPTHARLGQRIDEVAIAGPERWARAHLRTLDLHYRKAPYYAPYRDRLAARYAAGYDRLGELSIAMIEDLCEWLALPARLLRSSALGIAGRSTARLVAICRAVGAGTYLSGENALGAYLDARQFERAGICLRAHRAPEIVYRQQYPAAGFVPDLAALDLLFNEGPDQAVRLLRGSSVVET